MRRGIAGKCEAAMGAVGASAFGPQANIPNWIGTRARCCGNGGLPIADRLPVEPLVCAHR
jgi:hypothetical protein